MGDGKRSRKRRIRNTVTVISLLIALGGVLADPIATIVTDDPPVVACSAEVSEYVQLQKADPTIDYSVDEDSELNKQCDINDVLARIRKAAAEEATPADPSDPADQP